MSTFELRDFHLFSLVQFLVALSVFTEQPAMVLGLHLMLLLQIVILLLQVLVLVLTAKNKTYMSSVDVCFSV